MSKSPILSHGLSLLTICCLAFLGVGTSDSGGRGGSSQPSAPQTRKERIESQFSSWDGSHRGLTRVVKAAMNDPKSYEHVETRYSDQGDYLIVITKFRGKNAFGGVVLNYVKAKVDLDGNVVEILEQGP